MSFELMALAVKVKLPTTQKIVLLMLADRTNNDTGRCDPSLDRLAEDCGMSRRAVINAIKALENGGYIEAIRRQTEGVCLPNQYSLKLQNIVGVVNDVHQGSERRALGGSERRAPEPGSIQPINEPTTDANASGSGNAVSAPQCPHQKIIDLYHTHLAMGTQVRIWTGTRAKHLQARWREAKDRQNPEWWGKFFAYIAQSKFLTGQVTKPDRDPFVLSLGWIVKPENFAKIIEGNYHRSAS